MLPRLHLQVSAGGADACLSCLQSLQITDGSDVDVENLLRQLQSFDPDDPSLTASEHAELLTAKYNLVVQLTQELCAARHTTNSKHNQLVQEVAVLTARLEKSLQDILLLKTEQSESAEANHDLSQKVGSLETAELKSRTEHDTMIKQMELLKEAQRAHQQARDDELMVRVVTWSTVSPLLAL